MNNIAIRTSIFWILCFGIVGLVVAYRAHHHTAPKPAANELLAAGPESQATAAAAAQSMEAPLAPVQLTMEQMQSIGVKSGIVQMRQLDDAISATGTVDINERAVAYVQTRFPGYIRKVFANASYQYVRKGDPLFTIYSPDIVATQQEYLLARQNQKAMSTSTIDGVANGAASLTNAAEQRLKQWDIPESEIARLKQSGSASREMTVYSPVSGYITERLALPNMSADPTMHLYTIADLSNVWVNAQVFQNDIGRVQPGERADVTVDAYPGKTFSAHVEQILPLVDMATRTVRVRLAVSNAGMKLKPGMFVNVMLKSALGKQLVVPASAVFQTGTRALVFLDHGNGSIEPKSVVLGPAVGDEIVILKGLTANEQIVTSANFLIDSESQLQAASGAQPLAAPASATPQQVATSAMKIDFSSNPNPPHKGQNTFRVTVKDAAGNAVAGADVTVTLYMPAMPEMGMAAVKVTAKLAQKSAGVYEGSAKLDSGGTFQVTVSVQQNGKTVGSKQMRVNAEGGM
jgi:Cu(I)/Ag(I) efflux system membrane fusion protein/cobalt-zinc-cadmium efflux system membrane fusion protein